MKPLRWSVLLAFCIIAIGLQSRTPPRPTYELYSWQNDDQRWKFSLMYTTDGNKTPEEIFSEKASLLGPEQLKKKISRLRRGSMIVWPSQIIWHNSPLKGTERLKYPPKELIDDVKRHASTRNI